ncbi:hypothetical protein FRC09_003008 [Ceratobasidium sp. 395]|nr:hypothetical protein FRC09_003008 [Ceratobasidium sp. 395]
MPGLVGKSPALALNTPNGRSRSPLFRAPPPAQLGERSGRRPSNRSLRWRWITRRSLRHPRSSFLPSRRIRTPTRFICHPSLPCPASPACRLPTVTARDCESDRESRSSRQRQPSTNERVQVKILNQQDSLDRFYLRGAGLCLPVTPLPSRYDPRLTCSTQRWGTIVVHHVTRVDGVPSVCITSAGVISGGHGRHIVPDPGDAGSQSQQHSTFKVKLGESDSVPRPPVPGSAANHARSVSGSNGSARLRTTPSPTMGPPHGVVDEDYDASGGVDALIALSTYQGASAGKPG